MGNIENEIIRETVKEVYRNEAQKKDRLYRKERIKNIITQFDYNDMTVDDLEEILKTFEKETDFLKVLINEMEK